MLDEVFGDLPALYWPLSTHLQIRLISAYGCVAIKFLGSRLLK